MDINLIIKIVPVAIGILGFTFGLYKHFSTRKIAKVVYEITQLADFPMPKEFVFGVEQVPIMVTIQNTGNKMAQSILLHLKTKSPIEGFLIATDEKSEEFHGENELTLRVPQLNPSDLVKVFVYCHKGDIRQDLLTDFRVTHSEGVGKSYPLQWR